MTASPDFDPPQQTPPFLKAVSPNLYQMQTERPAEAALPQQLVFEILSEDLNQTQPLQGTAVIDFPGFGVPYPDMNDHRLTAVSIPPGHLIGSDAGPRLITTPTFRLSNRALGCHSVTLIVSHQFEFDNPIISPAKPGDVATLTWWYLLVTPAGELPDGVPGCFATQPGDADGGDASVDASVALP